MAALALAMAPATVLAGAATPAGAAETVIPVSGSVVMTSIICADETHCLGFGGFGSGSGFVSTLSGTTLSSPAALPTPGSGYGVNSIAALSCPTASTCYGVGQGSDLSTPFGYVVPMLYGVPQTPIVVHDVMSLSGITCQTGTTSCIAVGQAAGVPGGMFRSGAVVQLSGGNEVGSAHYVATAWSFAAVACETGTTDCVAAGQGEDAPNAPLVGAVLPIDAGTVGALETVPSVSQLTGIDCESASTCWAAGYGSGSSAVVPVADQVPGTPIAETTLSQTATVTCSSTAQCYATGKGPDASTGSDDGYIVPIASDVPGTPDLVAGTYSVADVACPLVTQCVAAATQQYNGDYEGVFVGDALPVPPATISGVTLSGSGRGLTVTVNGANFGDLRPTPSPEVPISCAKGDTSYDYPSGVLEFSDATEGWNAGESGDCIGLVVDTWTDTKVVLGFSTSYVYPLLQTGDQYSVTVLGTTASGTAGPITDPVPTITSVAFTGTTAVPEVTVTGTGFGAASPWTTGSPGCVSPDASQIFEQASVVFQDTTSSWTAGEPGNCLGLTVVKWSRTIVQFKFGAFYSQLASMFDGDGYSVSVLGQTFAGTVSGLGGVDISSVFFANLGSGSTSVTVNGSGFGSKPGGAVHPGCGGTDKSVDFPGQSFAFTDLSDYWTAGNGGDCVGVFIKSWTATSVVFTFGPEYLDYGPVYSGDQFAVVIKRTEYQGTAS